MNFLRVRILTHSLFWAGMFYLSGSILIGLVPFRIIVFRSLFVFAIQAGIAYINMFWLVPGWFLKGRYYEYAGLLVLTTLSLAAIRYWVEPGFFTEAQFVRFVPAGSYSIVLFSSTVAVLLMSTGYALAENYFKVQILRGDLENKHLEAETNFLRSQVNPHFLFNILNNLYSLVLLQSPKAPDTIIKLSNLMRFMLYEADEKQISLEKEIQYLNDFIDLELLRFEIRPDVQFVVKIISNNRKLAPMLLIPCVENAFKYSGIGSVEGAFIFIRLLENEAGELLFSVKNSLSGSSRISESTGGIGLKNLKKRLQLLFQDRFTLEVLNGASFFQVDIILPPE